MLKNVKFHFSRYGISILLILAEVGGIAALFSVLAHYVPLLWIAAFITSFVAFLSIVNLNTNPEYKVPWLSIVLLLPPLGALLYGMFYHRKMKKKEIAHLDKLSETMNEIAKDTTTLNGLRREDRLAFGKALSLVRDDPHAEAYMQTSASYFGLGEQMFEQILLDLEGAQNFIFLEYFIVENGLMWDTMLHILKEKAACGVEIRMLFDDIGCMFTLPENYDATLRSYGIDCYRFSKLVPEATTVHNNRDHRKILVVDGKFGYTGGINLADEYINHTVIHGHWKDGGIRLEGMAVKGLMKLFLMNWDINQKTVSDYDDYLSAATPVASENENGVYIPFGSGPMPAYHVPVGENAFLNIINQAQNYVYITTPYLIIDYDLTEALERAAVRGVDVRIITPHVPDKKLVQLLTRNTYPALTQSGVRIYEYTPGFIHSKTVLSDDDYAIVGTINFDFRSLVHHYENAVWMYHSEITVLIKNDILNTISVSKEMTIDSVKMNWFQKIVRDLIRLFAPLF